LSDHLLQRLKEAASDDEREGLVLEFSLTTLTDEVRAAVFAAAIPRHFDARFLAALLSTPKQAADTVIETLLGLSYIQRDQSVGFAMNERTRRQLLDRMWELDKPRFYELSEAAAAYCFQQDRNEPRWYIEFIYHSSPACRKSVVGLIRRTMSSFHRGPDFFQRCARDIPRAVKEQADAGRYSGHVPDTLEFWQAMTGPQRGVFRVALVFEGGGALCAYQAGVYQAIHEVGIEPDWVVGEAIGAVNAAIIAGNPPERRLDRLLAFWDKTSSQATGAAFPAFGAWQSVAFGVPGLYGTKPSANVLNPFGFWLDLMGKSANPLDLMGKPANPAYFDLEPLRQTLLELVDFDLLNSSNVHFSTSAVNVANGNFRYFDNTQVKIEPAHIMASVALPSLTPMIEVGGELYWSGSLLSQSPLQQALNTAHNDDVLVLQANLFPALGNVPSDRLQVQTREQEIRYSSRARLVADYYRQLHHIRTVLKGVLDKIPEESLSETERDWKRTLDDDPRVSVVNLVYQRHSEAQQMATNDFDRKAIRAHWTQGYQDTLRVITERVWEPG
jgi:NTE family protein